VSTIQRGGGWQFAEEAKQAGGSVRDRSREYCRRGPEVARRIFREGYLEESREGGDKREKLLWLGSRRESLGGQKAQESNGLRPGKTGERKGARLFEWEEVAGARGRGLTGFLL